jgi:hypothetical protein
VSHLKLQVFFTPLAAPNIHSRQIHHAITKRILIVPCRLTSALHILQHALKKMVTEKVIKRTQIGVSDVIKLKDISSNIIVAGNKWNDSIPALWELVVSTETTDRFLKKMQTSGLTAKL